MESSNLIRSIKDGQGPLGRNATETTRAARPSLVRVYYCGGGEAAFAVLVEQGREVAAEASRARDNLQGWEVCLRDSLKQARGCRRSIAEERLVQIVDRRHGELLEGGSSDGVAGAVSHALLAASDPDGGAESGEVSGCS